MSDLKQYDVVALGELLIDFTQNGISDQGNPLFEANPGGAPCNVLSMLTRFGKKVGFIGKVGKDGFGGIRINFGEIWFDGFIFCILFLLLIELNFLKI